MFFRSPAEHYLRPPPDINNVSSLITLGGCRWDGSNKLRWEDGDCVGDFTWRVRIIRLCWEFGDDQDCAGRSSGGNTGWGYHW